MNRQDTESDFVLDSDFIDSVADSIDIEVADEGRVSQLRARIMESIDDSNNGSSLFDTIRSDEGDWIEIDKVGAYSNASATRFNGFFAETFVEVHDAPPANSMMASAA